MNILLIYSLLSYLTHIGMIIIYLKKREKFNWKWKKWNTIWCILAPISLAWIILFIILIRPMVHFVGKE